MRLKALSAEDCEQVRIWRNEQLESLRTPFPLAKEQQKVFYETVVCNRQANARYWGLWKDEENWNTGIIGMVGLENIQWENRLGEISLLLNNADTRTFEQAVHLVLQQGLMNLNLENIYTEVYYCSPHIKTWIDISDEYVNQRTILPNRKYFNGQYFDSLYLNFTKEDFLEHENIISKSAQTPD